MGDDGRVKELSQKSGRASGVGIHAHSDVDTEMINALVEEHMAEHNIPSLPDFIERTLIANLFTLIVCLTEEVLSEATISVLGMSETQTPHQRHRVRDPPLLQQTQSHDSNCTRRTHKLTGADVTVSLAALSTLERQKTLQRSAAAVAHSKEDSEGGGLSAPVAFMSGALAGGAAVACAGMWKK